MPPVLYIHKMAIIHNSETLKELQKAGALQVSRDKIPFEFADKIVPVCEVNPKLLRRTNFNVNSLTTSTGSSTILSGVANKQFFITGIQWCVVKDAACDTSSGSCTITISQDGASKALITVPVITLLAQQLTGEMTFPEPIQTDINSNIAWNSKTFTAGVFQRACTIYGYYVDNINA